jgi:hypothetical protein
MEEMKEKAVRDSINMVLMMAGTRPTFTGVVGNPNKMIRTAEKPIKGLFKNPKSPLKIIGDQGKFFIKRLLQK